MIGEFLEYLMIPVSAEQSVGVLINKTLALLKQLKEITGSFSKCQLWKCITKTNLTNLTTNRVRRSFNMVLLGRINNSNQYIIKIY